MKPKWILWGLLGAAGLVLFVVIGGEVVRRLWNWLAPPLFGGTPITFWQALGLLTLCRILFGGFGGGGGYHGPIEHRRKRDRSVDRMADRVAERWEEMNEQERARFRERVREECGFDPAR